jgi:TolB protein
MGYARQEGNRRMRERKTAAAAVLAGLLWITAASQELIAAKLGFFHAHKDVGVTPKKGTSKVTGKSGGYRVTGGGANIWGKADAFQMVYKQMSGDVTLTADVHFVGQGVEQHRKAALMVRQSLAPDSAYADVALHGDGLTSLQYRVAAGEETKESKSELKAPVRIRLRRQGDEFTLEAGNVGEELKAIGPVTVKLHDPVYVGLAVGSHNADVLETAVFSNVEVKSGEQQRSQAFRELLGEGVLRASR